MHASRVAASSWSSARGTFCNCLCWGFALTLLLSGRPAWADDEKKQPAEGERRVGRLIRIEAPVTDNLVQRISAAVDRSLRAAKQRGEWPVFIFEIQPGQTEFGQAVSLARFLSGSSLNGATTVAYIPQSITGHAVLVAMACDEIIMAEEASIGLAGDHEKVIDPIMSAAYAEIADRRKSVPRALALGMLDSSLEVHVVETDVSREFVLSTQLAALREEKAFQGSKVLKPAGKGGSFTGSEGRELGFVSYLAEDRQGVAKALGLPRESIEEDPSLGGDWRPVRIDVKGTINATTANQVQTLIQNQMREHDANFVCLWVDSAGGAPIDSMQLASFVASLDPGQVRTVAYIPEQALADAAYIALACDNVVMHPNALLGGPGNSDPDDEAVNLIVQSLNDISAKKFRSPALVAAMVDSSKIVYRYTRQDGLVDYFTEEGAAGLADADQWKKGEAINIRGELFRADGRRAVDLGLARSTAETFNEFKAQYGLQDDPALVEPGWADTLIDALNSPGMSFLLLLIGGAALYAEFQAPGIGLGALIAGLCFLLFFWSRYLGGTAGWLEVLLFGAGVICLLIEIFVLPGVGVFGLFGGLLIISSLILASQTFVLPRNAYQIGQVRNTLLTLAGAGVGTIAAVIMLRRYLPHAPMFSHMVLAPPTGEEVSYLAQREALADFTHLLGHEGIAATPLLPAGKAMINDELVDVIARGDFADAGSTVRVVEVRGNHVLVELVV